MSSHSRRDFLFATLAPAIARLQPLPGGRLLGTIRFEAPSARSAPLNRLLGSGLDARLFTDLSTLAPQSDLVTPNERFYVRTAAPEDLRPRQEPPSRPSPAGPPTSFGAAGPLAWTEVVARLDRSTARVRVGPYLMECAGNSDPANFGLMSVASWIGFPMPAVVEQLAGDRAGRRVLVSGMDPTGPSARAGFSRAISWNTQSSRSR